MEKKKYRCCSCGHVFVSALASCAKCESNSVEVLTPPVEERAPDPAYLTERL